MPGLHEVQRAFSRSLLSASAPETGDLVRPNGLTSARRVQVYRNNVFASLTEALRAVYQVVERLVGEGFFRYAAHRFIVGHASRSGNLHRFGREFPQFLTKFDPAAALAYLPDVARLEWASHEVYHAAALPPLDIRRLHTVDSNDYHRLRFRLNPTTRLIDSPYPVLRILEANQNDTGDAATVDLAAGGERVLVMQQDTELKLQRLGAGDYAFLSALGRDCSLGESAAAALDSNRQFDLQSCLIHHVQHHVLVDIVTP